MASVQTAASDIALSLSSVFAYWKEFDLDARRSKLDEVGLKVASLQEQSTANRKKLADATRDFKRNSSQQADSDYATAAGNLLKQYQEEIDALTRRAKHGEAAFLDLYDKLVEAPDPAHALAAALDTETQLATVTAQLQKVSTELAEYKAESKAIKNQDLRIRKQDESIRELTAALEAKDQELQDARKQAAAEADAAVLQRMQARESELTEMLTSAQSSLEAMKRLYAAAQNQLFELQSSREEVVVGRQEEVELAAAELEAVQARLIALEAQKDNLQAKLENSRQEAAVAAVQGGSSSMGSVEETLRQELDSQREVSARLRQELAAVRQQQYETQAHWEERYSALQDDLSAQQAANDQLHRELQSRPSIAQLQELQQQVRALQAVGYGSLDELITGAPQSTADPGADTAAGAALDTTTTAETSETAGGVTAAGGSGGLVMNLERLLLAKNRKLEHEVTMSRLAVAEASQELEACKEQVSDLQDQLQQKRELISSLEDDLLAVRQAATTTAAVNSSTSTSASGTTAAAAAVSGSLDAAYCVSVPLADDGGDNQVLRVLAGQRDRLRQRMQELEVQLANTTAELQAAQQQLAAARADNVALIERLRYVGGYRQQVAASRTASLAVGGGVGNGADVESGAEVVGKYSQMYEEGINPFKQFQGQQQEQKRKQMSIADKAMYSVGSLVYQSPTARLLAFAYIVILHLLVFGSLTHMNHRTSEHLMDHQELLLQHGRHDLTGMMHGAGDTGWAAAVAAAEAPPAPG